MRLLSLAVLAFVVSGIGCASQRTLLRPGDRPDELAAAIASKGQSTDAADIKPQAGSDSWPEAMKKIQAVCLATVTFPFWAGAQLLGQGPGS